MYVHPKKAIKHFNVTENTLRVWANKGKINYITTEGGHRRYLIENTKKQTNQPLKIIYSRVSSKKQQGDLDRQTQYL